MRGKQFIKQPQNIKQELTTEELLNEFLTDCKARNLREGHLPTYKIALPRLLIIPTLTSFVEWRTWCLEAFLIGTGCRISTALSVKIKELNLQEGFVSFIHLKNRKVQLTPISTELKKIIETYLSLWDFSDEDYLFNNSYKEDGRAAVCSNCNES